MSDATNPFEGGARSTKSKLSLSEPERRVLKGKSRQEYFVYVPDTAGSEAALFVSVHGFSRSADVYARLFVPYCERYGVVLVAPHFSKQQFLDFQRLGRVGRGERADLALISIVEEVASATCASAQAIHLFGHSAGGRFVQRFVMAHPERVAGAVIASAGSYTFPNAEKRFPRGIAATEDLPGVKFEPAAFLKVPITVFVDEHDAGNHAPRRGDEGSSEQDVTLIENAANWVAAMKTCAATHELPCLVSYEKVAGENQTFRKFMKNGALGERTFGALFGPPPQRPEKGLETLSAGAREDDLPDFDEPDDERIAGSARLRRIALPLVLACALLAIASPIGLWAHYRYSHVVSRNALVRGHIADVGVALTGVVSSVEVKEGDHVAAGQVVARLDDRQQQARARGAGSRLERATRELEVERLTIENERRRLKSWVAELSAGSAAAGAQVRVAQSRADDAQRRLELLRNLADEGLSPDAEVRAAENELRTARALVAASRADHEAAGAARDSAQVELEGLEVREKRIAVLEAGIDSFRAELASAEADLAESVIRAPDSGAVVRRFIEPGGTAVAGQPILSLWIGDELWIEAWVDEDDLPQIERGAPATVTLEPYPDREFAGVVQGISVSTDVELPETEVAQPRFARMRSTPVIAVRIRLEEAIDGLFPGLSAIVGIRKKDR